MAVHEYLTQHREPVCLPESNSCIHFFFLFTNLSHFFSAWHRELKNVNISFRIYRYIKTFHCMHLMIMMLDTFFDKSHLKS